MKEMKKRFPSNLDFAHNYNQSEGGKIWIF